jgi:FtsP/CotA-like multicopper oxidase with cupredoxin domain
MRRLKYRLTRRQLNVLKNRQELIKAGISRRDLLKMGLMTGAGVLVDGLSVSKAFADGSHGDTVPLGSTFGTGTTVSPPITPFLDLLPTPRDGTWRIQTATALTPAPTAAPNTAAGEGRTIAHQAFTQFPPQKFYAVTQKAGALRITSDPTIAAQNLWGFAIGTPEQNNPINVPGPLYVERYNTPVLVRNFNRLPPEGQNGGFGKPSVTTHLHNGHTPSESDGNPCNYFEIGQFYDQHYPNVLAGINSTHPGTGDIQEAMGTLWYHDHRVDFTAQNTYKGLAGMYLLFNDLDSGDELTGFHLPSFPQFDIPMVFNDKVIDPTTGQIFFDLFNLDGVLGDRFLVNGKVQPVLHVSPRRYRFRWLNTGPSRFYQFFLTDLTNLSANNTFWQISTDGNLTDKPYLVSSARVAVAERVDVIVDFTGKAGKTFYIENRLQQTDGRGPSGGLFSAGQGNLLLKIVVDGPQVADNSVNPANIKLFYGFPSTTGTPRAQRTFEFDNTRGSNWTINDKIFACEDIRFRVLKNSIEKWTFVNKGRNWHHPIHMHFEEFQTLSINGNAPKTSPLVQKGRKDVARLESDDTHVLFFRFRDFHGRYPMHCHNVVHEDHAMMLHMEIVDTGGDTNPKP